MTEPRATKKSTPEELENVVEFLNRLSTLTTADQVEALQLLEEKKPFSQKWKCKRGKRHLLLEATDKGIWSKFCRD